MTPESELIVDASFPDVWKIFIDVDQRARWQQSFSAYEKISGTVGQPRSVGEITLVEKDRQRVLTERITERRGESFSRQLMPLMREPYCSYINLKQ
jgi:hypothetical protein